MKTKLLTILLICSTCLLFSQSKAPTGIFYTNVSFNRDTGNAITSFGAYNIPQYGFQNVGSYITGDIYDSCSGTTDSLIFFVNSKRWAFSTGPGLTGGFNEYKICELTDSTYCISVVNAGNTFNRYFKDYNIQNPSIYLYFRGAVKGKFVYYGTTASLSTYH